MIKIVTIVGARPQFIKASALSRSIRKDFSSELQEILVHTGQHYDANMSEVFFSELELPEPDYRLIIGQETHARQTAQMMTGIESILEKEAPDYVVVYGDTNSTLAGALAAAKMNIPVVHVEAGLRSFNKTMPEEINRIVCDHCSTLLFCPTTTGYINLMNEGIKGKNDYLFSSDNPGVFHCGDIMFDNTLYFMHRAEEKSEFLAIHGLDPGKFILATIHRANNTDQVSRLTSIVRALLEIIDLSGLKVIFPLHPRTLKMLKQQPDQKLLDIIDATEKLIMIPPVSFLEMAALEKNCRMVITDSGGVQKEAYFYSKPTIITRDETEWIEIVKNGCAILAGASQQFIVDGFKHFIHHPPLLYPPLFGDGKAAQFICTELIKHYSSFHQPG